MRLIPSPARNQSVQVGQHVSDGETRTRAFSSVRDQRAVHIDEAIDLIVEIIKRAIRDFLTLSHATSLSDRFDYETACQFLFDDSYRIDYGGVEKSFQDLADIIGIDVQWIREKIMQGKDQLILGQKRTSNYDEEETEE